MTRVSLESRLASVVGVRPAIAAPVPQFLVGATVRSVTGRAGVVVEVYEGERRIRMADGNREWFNADQLVGVMPKRARRHRRSGGGSC